MRKPYKHFLYITLPLLLMAVLQNGCKKKEIYPAQQLPRIELLTPDEGMVGASIVIKGTNLQHVNKVRFGAIDAAGFNPGSNTDSTIAVEVPGGLEPGNHFVQVYLSGETGYASMEFTVLETPRRPAITSVNPKKAFPDDEITINGVDMANVTLIKFDTVSTTAFSATDTKITVKVPLQAVGGDQFIIITNPVGSDSVAFTVDLSPVITAINPGSGEPGDSVVITGKRFNNIQSVKLGSLDAGFVVVDESTIKFEIPAGASSNPVTVTNAIGTATSADPFTVQGAIAVLEPVADVNLVFFDFNGTGAKDRWWGDVGDLENDPGLSFDGGYYRVNTNGSTVTDWNGFFWRNGSNNFPGSTIGTNINDYVLKFDIYVIDPITGGEFAWRLKGTEGDFWYYWKPWATTGSFRTFGWKTYSIPLSDFTDGTNHITDLNSITEDFGVAFNNGTSVLNVAIDNVRFEHK